MIIKHVLTIHMFKKYTGRPNYYDKRTFVVHCYILRQTLIILQSYEC